MKKYTTKICKVKKGKAYIKKQKCQLLKTNAFKKGLAPNVTLVKNGMK